MAKMAKKAKKAARRKRAPKKRTKTPSEILADEDHDQWQLFRDEHDWIEYARDVWCDLDDLPPDEHDRATKIGDVRIDPDYDGIGVGIFMNAISADVRYRDMSTADQLHLAVTVVQLCCRLEGYWCS